MSVFSHCCWCLSLRSVSDFGLILVPGFSLRRAGFQFRPDFTRGRPERRMYRPLMAVVLPR